METRSTRSALGQTARSESGITGLETAIVLIAFVVVASVFAFAVLSTGLVSTEKSKETVLGGLRESQSTLVLRGSVTAERNPFLETIDFVRFQVGNAARNAEGVDLSSSAVVVTYIDDSQSVNLAASAWTPLDWLSGAGPLLEPDERVEFTVNLTGLSTALSTSTEFTLQVKPNVGATLNIKRTTPPVLTAFVNLQ